MADIHKDRVLASYESLWTSRLYSDLIIRCGSNEYKVHQSVICPRSVFFTKACNGVLKEAKTATTIITDDDDPQTLRRMLSYLYTLDYSDGRLPDDPVETVVAVPALPPHLRHKIQTKTGGEDKYDIPKLKELAKRKFHALIENEWTSMEFQAVTDAVFGTTLGQDTSLRYIMSQICMDHFQDIIKDVRVRSVIPSNKDLTHALLEYATREKINDMQLLNRALAKQISMEDDLSRAKLANRRALDQNKQRETMLQDELAEAKLTIQQALDKYRQMETVLLDELVNAKVTIQRALDKYRQMETVLHDELANAKVIIPRTLDLNKQRETVLQDELAKAKLTIRQTQD